MEIPAAVAANAALTRQAIALEVVKMAAQMDRQLVAIIENATQTVPPSNRGARVNLSA